MAKNDKNEVKSETITNSPVQALPAIVAVIPAAPVESSIEKLLRMQAELVEMQKSILGDANVVAELKAEREKLVMRMGEIDKALNAIGQPVNSGNNNEPRKPAGRPAFTPEQKAAAQKARDEKKLAEFKAKLGLAPDADLAKLPDAPTPHVPVLVTTETMAKAA